MIVLYIMTKIYHQPSEVIEMICNTIQLGLILLI